MKGELTFGTIYKGEDPDPIKTKITINAELVDEAPRAMKMNLNIEYKD